MRQLLSVFILTAYWGGCGARHPDGSEADASGVDAQKDEGIPNGDRFVDSSIDVGGNPFTCIAGGLGEEATVGTPSLPVKPGFLWNVPLPAPGAAGRILTGVGGGVALTQDGTISLFDAAGRLVFSSGLGSPLSGIGMSSSVADQRGNLYFFDSGAAYALSSSGTLLWTTPLQMDISSTPEFSVVSPPLFGPPGRLYLPTLDGNLIAVDSSDGRVISTFKLGVAAATRVYAGLGDVVFADRGHLAGPGRVATGLFSIGRGEWLGEITVGQGTNPAGIMLGHSLGIVAYGFADGSSDKQEVRVLDYCGREKWRVSGSYARPLAISFNDELVVQDQTPVAGSPGLYTYAVRRFDRFGALVAQRQISDQPGWANIGADDKMYVCADSSNAIVALDRSLAQVDIIPLEKASCMHEPMILNIDGQLFFQCVDWSTQKHYLCAVQTTSPGTAPVSWPNQSARDAHATFWLSP